MATPKGDVIGVAGVPHPTDAASACTLSGTERQLETIRYDFFGGSMCLVDCSFSLQMNSIIS